MKIGVRPAILGQNVAIELDGDAVHAKMQVLEQRGDREAVRNVSRIAIHDN